MTDLSTNPMTGNDTGTIPSPWKILIFVSLTGTLLALAALTVAIVLATRVAEVEKRPTPCLDNFRSAACAKDAQRIIRGCLTDRDCRTVMEGIGPQLRHDEHHRGGDGSGSPPGNSPPGGGPSPAPSPPPPNPGPQPNPGPSPSPKPEPKSGPVDKVTQTVCRLNLAGVRVCVEVPVG